MAVGNPYTEVVVTGYNPDPPSNDGQQTTANTVDWDKHKDELAGPVKTSVETTQTNVTAALDKRVMNASLTKTTTYTIALADRGKDVRFTGSAATTFTLMAAADAKQGFELLISNAGTAVLTVDGNAAELVGGSATQEILPSETLWIYCTGTAWNITSNPTIRTVDTKTTAYTVLVSDHERVIECDATSAAFAVTLPSAATVPEGFIVTIKKTDSSANAITITPDGSETIDGATSDSLPAQYTLRTIISDGTNWLVLGREDILTLDGEQASSSGTEVDFTDVPAGIKRVTITFEGVSLSGTDGIDVQLGDSGGFETTGYVSCGSRLENATAIDVTSSTSSFVIDTNAASFTVRGHMVLTLTDPAGFTWISSHILCGSTTVVLSGAGSKSLSSNLTQIRVTPSGSDTFDAGFINVLYG